MFSIKNIFKRLQYSFVLLSLKLKHRRSKGDLFIDYGWIKLLFSNDGDYQEVMYHANCLSYYESEVKTFSNYIKPGDAVVDVGANLGFLAVMFASLVGSEGKVFCFEPSVAIFKKLSKTLAANNLSPLVIPFNVGCGKEKSKVKLNTVSSSSGNSSIINEASLGESYETIEIVPLDSISELWSHPIKLIKIDTEGFEPDVLLGAREIIAKHQPIIYIEMGGSYMESTKKSLAILEEYGYETLIPDDIDWNKIGDGANFVSLPRRVSAKSFAQVPNA